MVHLSALPELLTQVEVEFPKRSAYPRRVRGIKFLLVWAFLNGLVPGSSAASARLIKVLPQFADAQGRVALNPSLYERDAYQAHLRTHPEERGGLRFDVQWRSRGLAQLTLRLELRGNRGRERTTAALEVPVKCRGFFSTWSKVSLTGDAYAKLGDLSAWRATLWQQDQLLGEQKSFLW